MLPPTDLSRHGATAGPTMILQIKVKQKPHAISGAKKKRRAGLFQFILHFVSDLVYNMYYYNTFLQDLIY